LPIKSFTNAAKSISRTPESVRFGDDPDVRVSSALEQEGLTSVPQVLLSTDKLRQYWPIQFGGGANV